jgi:hypothetical protein
MECFSLNPFCLGLLASLSYPRFPGGCQLALLPLLHGRLPWCTAQAVAFSLRAAPLPKTLAPVDWGVIPDLDRSQIKQLAHDTG